MTTRSLCRAAAAAAVGTVGLLTAASGPAAAQNPCYPPTPGCATTTSAAPNMKVSPSAKAVRASTGTGSLAQTGAIVVPTALIGVGLVAAGVVMKRSSRRDKTSTTQ